MDEPGRRSFRNSGSAEGFFISSSERSPYAGGRLGGQGVVRQRVCPGARGRRDQEDGEASRVRRSGQEEPAGGPLEERR